MHIALAEFKKVAACACYALRAGIEFWTDMESRCSVSAAEKRCTLSGPANSLIKQLLLFRLEEQRGNSRLSNSRMSSPSKKTPKGRPTKLSCFLVLCSDRAATQQNELQQIDAILQTYAQGFLTAWGNGVCTPLIGCIASTLGMFCNFCPH